MIGDKATGDFPTQFSQFLEFYLEKRWIWLFSFIMHTFLYIFIVLTKKGYQSLIPNSFFLENFNWSLATDSILEAISNIITLIIVEGDYFDFRYRN